MISVIQILLLLLNIARFLVFAHFIMSWLIRFEVLNLRQEFVAQVWYGLNGLLEPIYRPIRRYLPQTGGFDLAPLIVLIVIAALRIVISNNLYAY